MSKTLSKLDYAGIVILIYGSLFPVIIYHFWCSPFTQLFYCVINGILSLTVFIICMGDKIYTEKYFVAKCIMFGAFGISDALLIPHLYYNA